MKFIVTIPNLPSKDRAALLNGLLLAAARLAPDIERDELGIGVGVVED